MSNLQVTSGTATATLDARYDRTTAAAGTAQVYDADDLLRATAAVLRAADDPRAADVQALVGGREQ